MADAVGMTALGLQFQLAGTERLAPDALRRLQYRQLGALLEHALAYVPFYSRPLIEAGFVPGADLDDEIWRRIPILGRREVQRLGRTLEASRVPREHGGCAAFETRGSTGMTVCGTSTKIAAIFWEAAMLRDFLWHGMDLRGTYAAIRFPREVAVSAGGARAEVWSQGSGAAFATGPSYLFDILRPIPEQLDWLLELEPDHVNTYPTILREIVLESRRRGVRPQRLKAATAFGEPLPEDLRDLLRDHWHVPLNDTYSAVETGYIALQCPAGLHYHVQSETVFVEVLDDRGRPCAPGEIGRVIVTPLHNFAMPLIRYEIGDYAEAGPPCPCGRTLPVLTRILGRTHNMMALPGGRRTWPRVQYPIAYSGEPIVQYQVVQRSLALIEVRLVAEKRLSESQENRLRARLNDANEWDGVEIVFSYHESIPRRAGGQFAVCYSDVLAVSL